MTVFWCFLSPDLRSRGHENVGHSIDSWFSPFASPKLTVMSLQFLLFIYFHDYVIVDDLINFISIVNIMRIYKCHNKIKINESIIYT